MTRPTSSIKQDRAEHAQQAILAAASQLFLEGGISAISVRAIAHRAGVSTIGIYSHFNGKQGILDALYIRGFTLLSSAMDVAPELGAEQRLLAAAQQYLNFGEQNEGYYRLIFGEADNGYDPSAEARKAQIDAFNKLVDLSGSLLSQHNKKEDRRQFALELWALLHGYVSLKHHIIHAPELRDTEQASAQPSDSAFSAKAWDWRASAIQATSRLAKSYGLSQ